MAEFGAQKQRPLWASTGTKNPAYSDVKYVEMLVAPYSVNTMPPKTLDAYLDHGEPRLTIYDDLDEAKADFEKYAQIGLSFDKVSEELEAEGLASFNAGFDKLLNVIEQRRKQYVDGWVSFLRQL